MKKMVSLIFLTLLATSSFSQVSEPLKAANTDNEPAHMKQMLELQAKFRAARMPKYKDLHLDESWVCTRYHYDNDEVVNPKTRFIQYNDGSINGAKYGSGALTLRRWDLVAGLHVEGLIDIRVLKGKLIYETSINAFYENYQLESQYSPKFRVEFYTECSLAAR